MSFTASRLRDTIGVSPNKAFIEEVTTFISYVFPPLLCHFALAVLAITPQTRTIRLALCPVIVVLALRAAVPTLKNIERKPYDDLAFLMYMTTTRALDWGLARKPLVRHLRPANSTPSTLMDALDLVSNLRGHGWDWSRGMYIPRETRPSDRTRFIIYTILSAVYHQFVCATLHTAIRSFSPAGLSRGPVLDDTLLFFHKVIRVYFPVGLGSLSAGSIFDDSLPLYLRFLRSSVISILTVVWSYAVIQTCYDLCTIPAVLILGQDPAQWPPIFDAPWRATSLTDFWGRRWHQLLRHVFLIQAGYPLSFILGRTGIVVGSFLASAVFHHIQMTTYNNKSQFWRMLVGFGMMAPGIIVERLFKYVTGRKVLGFAGWLWTMGWILLWGNVIVDGFVRAGMFRLLSVIDLVPPARMLVERLVTEFDALLHARSTVGH